jgi:hypothetical protein
MEMTRKISVGGINGVRKGFKGITAPTILARVVGIARVTKWEDGDAGTYCKFTGDFSAWNKDGKGYRAPAVFLPEPAQSLLATAVDADESGNGVEFAFDLVAVPNANSATGYSWEARPLMEMRVADPMAALLAKINVVHAAPETKPDTQPETPPADDAGKGGEQEPGDAPLGSENPAPARGRGKKAA